MKFNSARRLCPSPKGRGEISTGFSARYGSLVASGLWAGVYAGTRLIEAAAEAGLVIEVPCGGEGLCGKCRVIVTSRRRIHGCRASILPAEELAAGWRLACQSAVCGPTEVETACFAGRCRTQDTVQTEGGGGLRRSTRAETLPELSPPREATTFPTLRLERALRPTAGWTFRFCAKPARLRRPIRGTVVGRTPPPTSSRAIPKPTPCRGVGHRHDDPGGGAVDLARAARARARLNPQTRFGDDVLSRILHARQDPDGLRQLQEAIARAVDVMIGELCSQAGIPRERIYAIAFAGNTTMQQLLCGVDTSSLGEVPFAPATGHALTFAAAELGLHIHPRGSAYVMPVIGGFVGGDTVAGILATGMAEADAPTLLVDIGTNGEIVLLADKKLRRRRPRRGRLFARISRRAAAPGAIEKVVVDGRLRTVIGNVRLWGLRLD